MCAHQKKHGKAKVSGAFNSAGLEQSQGGGIRGEDCCGAAPLRFVLPCMGFDAYLSLLRTGFCSPLSSAKWELTACSSLSTQLLLRPTEPAIWRQLTAVALLNSLLYMVWQIIVPIIILNDTAQGSAGE